MRKVSIKRMWIKKKNLKNVIKRTKRNKRKRQLNKTYKTRNKKYNYQYDNKKNEYKIDTPKDFSIMNYPEKTIEFFNNVLDILKNNNHNKVTLSFILDNVENITIDAIMYFIALIKNTKHLHGTKGTYPKNEDAKKILINSGFLTYVRSKTKNLDIKSNNNIQIRLSNKSNNNRIVCREINSTIMKRYDIEKKKLTFLYDIICEMMINTNEHAYNKQTFLAANWYIYVDLKEDKVCFSLLDTGMGIPNTVHKNFREKIMSMGNKNDSELMLSALNGEFKTATKQHFRGKGLPKFTKYNKMGKLSNFKLVSGKGKIEFDNNIEDYKITELDNKLEGTVYYFEIDINKLKEKEYEN